jgi:hypothetical protein
MIPWRRQPLFLSLPLTYQRASSGMHMGFIWWPWLEGNGQRGLEFYAPRPGGWGFNRWSTSDECGRVRCDSVGDRIQVEEGPSEWAPMAEAWVTRTRSIIAGSSGAPGNKEEVAGRAHKRWRRWPTCQRTTPADHLGRWAGWVMGVGRVVEEFGLRFLSSFILFSGSYSI